MSTTSTTQVRVKAASSRAKNFFFGNLTAKAMALIMALALWSYAYRESRQEEKWAVPVEIRMSEGWALSGDERQVTMTLTYPKALREEFKEARARGRIRMATTVTPEEEGPDEQTLEIELGQANLIAPAGLKVAVRHLSPTPFPVRVVREETRMLPVEVLVSDPPSGFELVSKRPSPDKVAVRGPRDVLSRATAIQTEIVDIGNLTPLRGLTAGQNLQARIAQYVIIDGERHNVVCDKEIEVQIALAAVPRRKTFTGIPIQLLATPRYPYVVEIREGERATDVDVSGPDEVVDKLEPANIVLYVDVRDLKPNADTALPYTQPILTVVETPRAGELTCRPALKNCSLTISEPETE